MALDQSTGTPSRPRRSPQDLNLPRPQTFDILPALHELLSRIDHASSDTNIPGLSDSPQDGGEIGALYTDQVPLEPKDLPNETLQIKTKIRNALKALEKLPDMDRTVEEQQLEIEELEERIARQRAMIVKLGEVAKGLQARMG